MARDKLSDRRFSVTVSVIHKLANDKEMKMLATFGRDHTKSPYVREIFCADFKSGTDIYGMVTDACVLISKLLQHGYSPAELAHSMGEPTSIIGALVKAAAKEDELSNKGE